jgi:N-formylglutamate amidohydrolase
MVTEEPQNAHLDSRGRATPDAPPASSYFESVQPRSRLARTRVTYKSMTQSLSQHLQRINHVSVMPVLCEARSIRKYYSKILTDHRDEMARGDVGRQADAIESMQHGIATALRCSF